MDAESLVWSMTAAYDGLAAYAGFVPDLDLHHISLKYVDVVLNGLTADSEHSDQGNEA